MRAIRIFIEHIEWGSKRSQCETKLVLRQLLCLLDGRTLRREIRPDEFGAALAILLGVFGVGVSMVPKKIRGQKIRGQASEKFVIGGKLGVRRLKNS